MIPYMKSGVSLLYFRVYVPVFFLILETVLLADTTLLAKNNKVGFKPPKLLS